MEEIRTKIQYWLDASETEIIKNICENSNEIPRIENLIIKHLKLWEKIRVLYILWYNKISIAAYLWKNYDKLITTKLEDINDQHELCSIWFVLDELEFNEDEAYNFYKKSLEINPNNHHALNYFWLFYTRRIYFELAITFFEKALKASPINAMILNNLWDCYQVQNMTDKAMECYQEVISFHPNDGHALNCIWAIHLEKKESMLAIMYLEMSNISRPEWMNEKARQCCEKALYIDPDNFLAKYNLGTLTKYDAEHDINHKQWHYKSTLMVLL